MSIKFTIDQKNKIILIRTIDDISPKDVLEMRTWTMELLTETGIENFVVDMSAATSILYQDTVTTYKMGKEFQGLDFPLSAKTAVILPNDEEVRRQATFLHTVEVNRMRGPLKYVENYEEALDWFKS